MKKGMILFSLLAAMTAGQLKAAPVERASALRVARHFWAARGGDRGAQSLEQCTAGWPYSHLLLFTRAEGGYVIVAADDAATPVLAYSLNSPMHPDRLPAHVHEWLQMYDGVIGRMAEDNAEASAKVAAQWQELLSAVPQIKGDGTGVAPMISTKWNQQSPYNEMCPGLDGDLACTGCAATAEAMLMKHYNYPPFGIGSHSYESANYGTLSADFAHTLYDWPNMPDEPTALSPEVERHAVAELMYHVGVALEMMYNTAENGGSGALGFVSYPTYPSMNNSLMNYFHYTTSMRIMDRDYGWTDVAWRDTLIAELDRRHPVPYCGSDPAGGHAFICDGYDADLMLHFNFGWSGEGDGYYTVDDISPLHGGAGGNSTYTFTLHNSALLNAVPDTSAYFNQTQLYFGRDGGEDSLLFAPGTLAAADWTVVCSADWLHVDRVDIGGAVMLRIVADNNASGSERSAELVMTAGTMSQKLNVGQDFYGEDDLCPVTVVMKSKSVPGWRGGAYLSLQSIHGRQYGEAALEVGMLDSVTINVAPKDMMAVWHSGGATDKLIQYKVLNAYGEVMLNVEDAYTAEKTYVLPESCTHLTGIRLADGAHMAVYPNPSSGLVTVEAEGLLRFEVIDIYGRVVMSSTGSTADLSQLPRGTYFLRAQTREGIASTTLILQ